MKIIQPKPETIYHFLDSRIRIVWTQMKTVYNGEIGMNQLDPRTHLLGHSEAKLKLYDAYLAKYLNILARNPYVERIFIFDLLCGEGIYGENEKGSPIIALETIKDHYYANNRSCPD